MIWLHIKRGFAVTLITIWFTIVSTVGFAQPSPDPNAAFPVEFLEIKTGNGTFKFSAEIADDSDERSRGLMFRETMLPTHGMLFDFGETTPIMMWMKNTPMSLDMVFIRENGTVARVASDTVPFSQTIVSSGEPVSHVLELKAGMAKQIGLKAEDKVIHRFFEHNN